jgi:hypothetical protein
MLGIEQRVEPRHSHNVGAQDMRRELLQVAGASAHFDRQAGLEPSRNLTIPRRIQPSQDRFFAPDEVMAAQDFL